MTKKLLPIIILLFGWTLMTWNIGRDSLWQNEIVSYVRATQPTLADTYTEIANDDSAPLYEMVFLRPWLFLGHNELFQRIPSAFFSILATAIVFRFAKALFDTKTALFALTLFAINPIQLYYAREGRMYALLSLMTIAWIYFLFRAIHADGRSKRAWWGYALFAAASVYTHYYGGITLLASAVFVVCYLLKTKNFELGKRWLVANIGAGLLFAPWLPSFFFQLSNDPISSIRVPTFAKFGKTAGQFFVGFYWLPGWVEWGLSLGVIGLILLSLVIIILRSGTGSTPFTVNAHLGTIFFVTLTLAFVLSKLITPLFVIRYFSGIVPVLVILVAYAISNLRMPVLVYGCFIAIFCANLFFAQNILTTVWRKDYKSAFQMIENRDEETQAVIFHSPGSKFWVDEFDHYNTFDEPVTYLESNDSLSNADVLAELDLLDLDANSGVWVVQSNEAHLVSDLNFAEDDYRIKHDESLLSHFFLQQRALKIIYIERTN